MIKLLQSRSSAHAFCLSLGMMAVTGDVVLNPHLYGEYVQWTWRSSIITAGTFLLWVVSMIVVNCVKRQQK